MRHPQTDFFHPRRFDSGLGGLRRLQEHVQMYQVAVEADQPRHVSVTAKLGAGWFGLWVAQVAPQTLASPRVALRGAGAPAAVAGVINVFVCLRQPHNWQISCCALGLVLSSSRLSFACGSCACTATTITCSQ